MQGASPGAADNVICVGSVGTTTQEYKSVFSNYGKRVNIWAPGSNIVSGVYDTTAAAEFGVTLVNDPRNSAYKLGSISGTSMSGPQVAGYLACVAEQQPRLTQADALQHVISNSNTTVGSSAGSWGDYTSLGPNSNNRYMFYKLVRPVTGATTPAVRFKDRPTTGSTYPRTRIRKYG
jgi:subtilisin family serine protease